MCYRNQRALAFASITYESGRFPRDSTPSSVRLDDCTFSPIYLSMGAHLLGSLNGSLNLSVRP